MKRLAICAAAATTLACSAAPAQPVSPIRLNQLGELPDGVKIAVLPSGRWASCGPREDRSVRRGSVVRRDCPPDRLQQFCRERTGLPAAGR